MMKFVEFLGTRKVLRDKWQIEEQAEEDGSLPGEDVAESRLGAVVSLG